MNDNARPPAYVVLSGELDLFRKNEVRAAFPDPGAVGSVVVNCTRAAYIDSTIIGMLVGLRRDFVSAGGDPANFILLTNKESIVCRALDLAGVTKLFAMAFVERTLAERGTV